MSDSKVILDTCIVSYLMRGGGTSFPVPPAHADASVAFFRKVQNKIHFAVHGNTDADVIYSRAEGCGAPPPCRLIFSLWQGGRHEGAWE